MVATTRKGRRQTLSLNRYDEGIAIGITGNVTDVLVKPSSDGKLDRRRLISALEALLSKLKRD